MGNQDKPLLAQQVLQGELKIWADFRDKVGIFPHRWDRLGDQKPFCGKQVGSEREICKREF